MLISYLLSGNAFVGPTKKLYLFDFLFEANLPKRQICKGEVGRIFAKWINYLRTYAKDANSCFTNITSFNPHENPVRLSIIITIG